MTGDTNYEWRVIRYLDAPEDIATAMRASGSLRQAVAAAKLYRVDIDLYDRQGFPCGWVHADGEWKLT